MARSRLVIAPPFPKYLPCPSCEQVDVYNADNGECFDEYIHKLSFHVIDADGFLVDHMAEFCHLCMESEIVKLARLCKLVKMSEFCIYLQDITSHVEPAIKKAAWFGNNLCAVRVMMFRIAGYFYQ